MIGRCASILLLLSLPTALAAQAYRPGLAPRFQAGLRLIPRAYIFDFTNGTLPSGATLTRNSVGTRTNIAGVLVTENANVARFNYDQVSHAPLGLLVEPQATNLLTYSDSFNQTIWLPRGFAAAVSGETDPWGGTTAFSFTENNTSSNAALYYNGNVTPSAPTTYQVWLKASVPTSFALSTQGSVSGGKISVTTSWQRFTVTQSVAGNGIGPHIGGYSTIAQGSGIKIYVCNAQLEAGSVATSYFATTTASGTRGADNVTLAWAGLSNGPVTVRYTFDDNSIQEISTTIASGTTTVPTTLNRPNLKSARIFY